MKYTINPKARWYDGTPITWEDFYWQWKASNGNEQGVPDRLVERLRAKSKASSKAKDDREVVVTFKRPYADWQALFNAALSGVDQQGPEGVQRGMEGHGR